MIGIVRILLKTFKNINDIAYYALILVLLKRTRIKTLDFLWLSVTWTICNSSRPRNFNFSFKTLLPNNYFQLGTSSDNIKLTHSYVVDAVRYGNCLPGIPLLQRLWSVSGLQPYLDLQRVRHCWLLHQLLPADVHLQAEEVTEQEQVERRVSWSSGSIHRTLGSCKETMIKVFLIESKKL